MTLKPQDTLLALKYWSIKSQGLSLSIRELAESTKISIGEISKGTRRLVASQIVVEREGRFVAERHALLEWLCFGVRYAYPAEIIGYGRGMPTAWHCPGVRTDILPPDPPTVWSVSGGGTEGTLLKPIHESVPLAASNDELLYEALSLVEAIRLGKPRELAVAREELSIILESYKSHWTDIKTI